jgi:Domain of unknown function (DUF6249)
MHESRILQEFHMGNLSFGAYLVGVAFWMFIGAIAIAGIVSDYQKRRLNVDLLRALIEKGQSIDPAVLAKLMSPEAFDENVNPTHLKLGGIITTAAGVGLMFMAYFISRIAPVALYPILGSGVITICVGVGLIVGAKVMADARERERTHKSAP